MGNTHVYKNFGGKPTPQPVPPPPEPQPAQSASNLWPTEQLLFKLLLELSKDIEVFKTLSTHLCNNNNNPQKCLGELDKLFE